MKIHDTSEDLNTTSKKGAVNRTEHQAIEMQFQNLETLTKVIQNKYHSTPQTKFTVRLPNDLESNLRIYGAEQGLTVQKSMEQICKQYFQNRWVTRSFFELEKPFTVAIPLTLHEIGKYITDEINCLIELSSDIDTRLAVQTSIISNDDTDYYLAVTFKHGNNYLDVYNKQFDCYLANNNGKEYHLGLYDIYNEFLDESVFIQVLFHEKTPVYAKIITFEDALEMSDNRANTILLQYLKDIDQAVTMREYKNQMQEQKNYVRTLEAQIENLENELSSLKNEMKTDDKKSEKTETIEKNQKSDRVSPYPIETQRMIKDATEQIMRVNAVYREAMRNIMNYPNISNENSQDAEDDCTEK